MLGMNWKVLICVSLMVPASMAAARSRVALVKSLVARVCSLFWIFRTGGANGIISRLGALSTAARGGLAGGYKSAMKVVVAATLRGSGDDGTESSSKNLELGLNSCSKEGMVASG